MQSEGIRPFAAFRPGARRRAAGALTLRAFVAGLALLGGAGCGSSSHSQASARDQVTAARCDREQACGNVGSGKTYSSLDNCLVQVRANWDTLWPAASCDGKIDEAQLRVCLDAIPLVKCNDALDLATSLVVNCSAAKVCAGP